MSRIDKVRYLVSGCLMALLLPGLRANAQNIEGQIIAAQYGEWQLYGTATNQFVFSPAACQLTAEGTNFVAFTQGVPVKIVNPGAPALTEVVNAGLVNIQACSVQLAPAFVHNAPFYVTSGTAGLQEAINANAPSGKQNAIILSAAWYALGGSSSTIASVKGTASLGLEDVTTTPATWYQWSGSQYVEVNSSSGGGTLLNGLSGAVNLAGDSTITVTPSGNSINLHSIGVGSINGDSTRAQQIDCTGGITCSTVGGVTSFNYSGSAGSGSVASGGPYNDAGYTPTSPGTAVGPVSNSLTLPVGLTSAQISAVLATSNIAIRLQAGDNTTPFTNTHFDPIHDDRTNIPADAWNVKESGASCDANFVQASITAGQTAITAGSGLSFASTDVGKFIETTGVVNGVPTRFDAEITAVGSSSSATMSGAAPFTSASPAFFTFGHQDNAALASAVSEGLVTGRAVALPNGTCWTTVPLRFGANIVGQGTMTQAGTADGRGSAIVGSAGEDVLQGPDPSTGEAFPPHMNTGGYNIYMNPTIDATLPWQICTAQGSCTAQTPLYRPIDILGPDGQDPLAPGWIQGSKQYNTGAINGIAFVTNGSNSFTVLNGETVPAVGEQVVFPYFSTLFTGTVATVSGDVVTLESGQNYPGSTIQPVGTATACSVTVSGSTGTATITVANSLSAGNVIGIFGFATSACDQLNNHTWTVISTGLSATQFEATSTGSFTGESTTTDSGTIYLWPVAAQEWFAGTSIQTIQTAIPATGRTFPMTVNLENPITPMPYLTTGQGQAGVGPWGYVQIDGEQCTYYGNSNLEANPSNSPQITLTACALNGTTAAAHSVGAVIVPLNPLEPSWPWPVPTNMGSMLPTSAAFYPAMGVGNAAISFPVANGLSWDGNSGLNFDTIHDIAIRLWNSSSVANTLGYQLQNDTAAIYLADPPFMTTIKGLQIVNTFYGIVEGMPSINTYGLNNAFPTVNGNKWEDIRIQSSAFDMIDTFESGFSMDDLNLFSESGAAPNQFYPQVTDTDAGGQGALIFDGPDLDQGTTFPYATLGVSYGNIHFTYLETEPGTLANKSVSFALNCNTCTWITPAPQGNNAVIVGGQDQTIYGGTLGASPAEPLLNIGYRNTFENMIGLGESGLSATYGSARLINWGPQTVAWGQTDIDGGISGPQTVGNNLAPVTGQTEETLATGNIAAPYVASGNGFITPDQFNTNGSLDENPMTQGWTLDPTSPITGSYAACHVGNTPTALGCAPTHMTGNFLPIGPGQRIVAGSYYAHLSVKTLLSDYTFTFSLFAQSAGSCSGGTIYEANLTSSGTGWQDYAIPVMNLASYSGCDFAAGFGGPGTDSTIDVGYLDMIPLKNQVTTNAVVLGGPGGPQILSGSGAPTGCGTTYPQGSTYSNTTGSLGSLYYVCGPSDTWENIK